MKHLRITVEGKCYEVEVELLNEDAELSAQEASSLKGVQSSTSQTQPTSTESKPSSTPVAKGAILSPLSAVVVSVDVTVGDTIEKGQKVITLEAMKMNTIVPASVAGTVEAIQVSVGDAVEEGQPLITVS